MLFSYRDSSKEANIGRNDTVIQTETGEGDSAMLCGLGPACQSHTPEALSPPWDMTR